MPALVELREASSTVHIEGADKLWALRSQLQIPLVNVISAQAATEEAHEWFHGLRVGGAEIPGVISVGRFCSHGEVVFWDVHEPDRAIAIGLHDERFDGLVIEAENPEQDIARIREAIAAVATLAAPA
jgi:hypothetical protein